MKNTRGENKMAKVVYIPLDESPCNYKYPQQLARMTDLKMLAPPKSILGDMKKPSDVNKLLTWIEEAVVDADHLIVSIDMLIYAGIVPSRMHTLTIQQCLK